MRRLRRIGLVLLVLAVVVVAWEPSRVAIQTAVLLPELARRRPEAAEPGHRGAAASSVTYRVANTRAS